MSKRSRQLLLEDMLEAANKIKIYCQEHTLESFLSDEKTKDAVTRNFEIIGEAANRLSSSLKEENPDLRWERLRGFRNRIVHEYFGVDHQIIWSIVENDLDFYIEEIQLLIKLNN